MYGRTDEQQYNEMLKQLVNGWVIPQGGIQTRPGTRLQIYTPTDFVVAGPSTTGTCIDFAGNDTQKYRNHQFKTGDGKRWGLLMNNSTLSTWNLYDIDNDILTMLPGRVNLGVDMGMGEFSFGHVTGDTPGGGNAIRAAAELSFVGVDLHEIQIEQSGDVLFITHTSIPPLTLRYVDNTVAPIATQSSTLQVDRWDIAFSHNGPIDNDTNDSQFKQYVPFLEKNSLNNFLRGSITWSGTSGLTDEMTLTSGASIFSSSWIGSYIRLTDLVAGVSGLVYITKYTSAAVVKARIIQTLPSSAFDYGVDADTYWEESAWSPKNGYPAAVCAFGGRVLYGGTPTRPNRVWASAVGDVAELCEIPYAQSSNFATYLNDESGAFSFDVIGCDIIRWMSAGRKVFIGARNKEFVAYDDSGGLTRTGRKVDAATNYGSAYRNPLRLGTEIVFVQRSLQRLRSLVFSFQEDDYKSQDISKLAEHIARASRNNLPQASALVPSFGSLTLATSPDSRIWCADNNGGLSSCTFDREAGVIAWSRHELGGQINYSGSYYTSPFVFSCSAQPSYDNSCDEIYVMIKRAIDGVNVITYEKIGGYFDETAYTNSTFIPPSFVDWLRTRAVFLDCAVGAYEAVATTDFTFDTHANELVSVLADGAYIGELTLDGSGNVTLPEAHNEVIIGYNYNTSILTMDLEIPGMQMSNQDKQKGTPEVWARFNRTSNAIAQRDGQSDIQRFDFVGNGNPSDAPVDLYTGDKRVHIGDLGRNLSIFIGQDKPLPFELLAIIFQGMIYD